MAGDQGAPEAWSLAERPDVGDAARAAQLAPGGFGKLLGAQLLRAVRRSSEIDPNVEESAEAK
jgi:hypothetical protein